MSICAEPHEFLFEAAGEEDTVALGHRLGAGLPRGAVVALHGGMGAGKTRFAQGLALAVGIATPVSSPTYALVHEYFAADGRLFVHMDLGRVADETAVADLGFQESLERADLAAIEWPEHAGALLPRDAVHVWLLPGPAENARHIRVRRCGGHA